MHFKQFPKNIILNETSSHILVVHAIDKHEKYIYIYIYIYI